MCYNDLLFHKASEIYKNYIWAKPILMKYQDFTFENAFWKQLNEIKNEWINCDMVGTLGFKSFNKINLNTVNKIIENKLYMPNSYYHFMDTNYEIENNNTSKHPLFQNIWCDIISSLKLVNTTENCCNYWMCKPLLMKNFIKWYTSKLLPELLNHPYPRVRTGKI